MMDETPKLPEGAADWVPMTSDEVDDASAPDVDAAREKINSRGGLLADLLNAGEYNETD